MIAGEKAGGKAREKATVGDLTRGELVVEVEVDVDVEMEI